MTTPDTAAVRAWAKDNGMAVADRGRLPADLHAAYLAANGGPVKPGAATPAGETKPVRATKRSAAAKKSAPAKPSAPKAASGPRARKAAAKSTRPKPAGSSASRAVDPGRDEDELDLVEEELADHVTQLAEADAPAPTASPDTSADVARLIALEVQLAALAGRVAALEETHAAPPPKQSRFRRRS